jgi:hypothetical protein
MGVDKNYEMQNPWAFMGFHASSYLLVMPLGGDGSAVALTNGLANRTNLLEV